MADAALRDTVAPVADRLGDVREIVWAGDAGAADGLPGISYAELLERGSDDPLPWTVDDEDATISINYTSGTTGQPKGVMYTHRGAYLNALGENVTAGHRVGHGLPLDAADVPLQRLVPRRGRSSAAGGTQVCLRGGARRARSGGSSTRRASRTCAARRPCSPCSSTTPAAHPLADGPVAS